MKHGILRKHLSSLLALIMIVGMLPMSVIHAGALSYLGANHASAYDIKYNEESDQGLSFTLDCRGIVENAIAQAIPTGFRFHTFNDTIALMHNLPYRTIFATGINRDA